MSGVHKGTVVRGESDFPSGALHITDCHDTVIYALAPLQVRIVSVVVVGFVRPPVISLTHLLVPSSCEKSH